MDRHSGGICSAPCDYVTAPTTRGDVFGVSCRGDAFGIKVAFYISITHGTVMQPQVLRDATGLNQAIRARRRQLGLTQADLGQRAGLAAKHVSRIENGTHEPRVSTLLALVSALELDLVIGEHGQIASAPSVNDIF